MLNQHIIKKGLRTYLANCGWQEVITYSLISFAMKEEFKEKHYEPFYQLTTPKIEHHKYYRQNLTASHLNAIKYNLSYGNRNLLFFEISMVYNLSTSPEELLILSGVGKIVSQSFHHWVHQLDFYWIKGVLENIFWRWRIEEQIHFEPTSLSYLFASQRAEIFLVQQKIGFIGQVNPQISHRYLVNEPTFIAQISLTKIFNYLEQSSATLAFYQPLSNFPRSEKDLSFIFPTVIDYQKVIHTMKKWGGETLQEVNIFDVYQNAELKQQGKKSVSFHLVFQSFTCTLETSEVEKVTKLIGKKIEELFQAKLRDKK